jgi:glyoxylase-like metal-dependent hydrolase (beta-lactamase superfamily II)
VADLTPGVAFALSPLVRRIVAHPALDEASGPNTYLVGIDEVAVIDPGPADDVHLDAVVGCGGDRIRWILPTHSHQRHAGGAAALRERTGAELLAFAGPLGLDGRLVDGDTIEATEFRLRVLHTAGHSPDHLCFVLQQERLLFAGDEVVAVGPTVVAPPDGDLGAHVEQLRRLGGLRLRALGPGHGDLVDDPPAKLANELSRLEDRERAVAAALVSAGRATVDEIVAAVAAVAPDPGGTPARLAVWAHLRKLAAEGRAVGDDLEGVWTAA